MFLPLTNYPVGESVQAISIGDLNGDQKGDVVIANYGSSTVGVLLNRGDDTFGAEVDFPTDKGPTALALVDLNGDGRLDAVVASFGNATVSVLMGKGDGTFAAARGFSAGDFPTSLAVADFNGDGALDVAVVNQYGNTVSVLLGNGDGTLQSPSSYPTGLTPVSVVAADVNGDGSPDLVVANSADETVGILFNRGDGTFGPQVALGVPGSPDSVIAADLRGQGGVDLAVGTSAVSSISVLLGAGDGGFLPPATYPSSQPAYSEPQIQLLAVGHFSGTESLDLAVAGNQSAAVQVLRNRGDGTFAPEIDYPLFSGFNQAMAVGKLDRGGPDDLFFGASSGAPPPGSLAVLLATGTYASGVLSDRAVYSAGSGVGAIALGDFNGDGLLDFAVTNYPSTVSISLGAPDGGFFADAAVAVGIVPNAIGVGDFNGDGYSDLAVVNNYSETVSVLLSYGDGGFASEAIYVTGEGSLSVVVGDFNRDGHLDLVVSNPMESTLSVLLGFGDGGFAAPMTRAIAQAPGWLATADFNGDGLLDLAFTAEQGIGVMYGLMDGGFSRPQGPTIGVYPADTPIYLAVADLNGDGRPDLIAAMWSLSSVYVLFGGPDGGFSQPTVLPTDPYPDSVAVGDFNGDGCLDLAISSGTTDSVSVDLGHCDGTFELPVAFVTGDYSESGQPVGVEGRLAVAHLNGDAHSDLAIANGDGTVAILRGQSCAFSPASDAGGGGSTGGTGGGSSGGSTGTAQCGAVGFGNSNADVGRSCTVGPSGLSTCAAGETCVSAEVTATGLGIPLLDGGTGICTASCREAVCPGSSNLCLIASSIQADSWFCIAGCNPTAPSPGGCPGDGGLVCIPTSPGGVDPGYCSVPLCEAAADCNGDAGTRFSCAGGFCRCTVDSDCATTQRGDACDAASGVCYSGCAGPSGTACDDREEGGCCLAFATPDGGTAEYCDLVASAGGDFSLFNPELAPCQPCQADFECASGRCDPDAFICAWPPGTGPGSGSGSGSGGGTGQSDSCYLEPCGCCGAACFSGDAPPASGAPLAGR